MSCAPCLRQFTFFFPSLWVALSCFHWQRQQDRVIILFFVGDQPIIQREMEGSDEGEVSLKEVKDTVLLLSKQMVEIKAAMSQREEISSRSSEYP